MATPNAFRESYIKSAPAQAPISLHLCPHPQVKILSLALIFLIITAIGGAGTALGATAFTDEQGRSRGVRFVEAPEGSVPPTESGFSNSFLDFKPISRHHYAVHNTGSLPITVAFSYGPMLRLQGRQFYGARPGRELYLKDLRGGDVLYAVALPWDHMAQSRDRALKIFLKDLAKIGFLEWLGKWTVGELLGPEKRNDIGQALVEALEDEITEVASDEFKHATVNYLKRCTNAVNAYNASRSIHQPQGGLVDHEWFCLGGIRPSWLEHQEEEEPDRYKRYQEAFYAYPLILKPGRSLMPSWYLPSIFLNSDDAMVNEHWNEWDVSNKGKLKGLSWGFGASRAITPDAMWGRSSVYSRLYLTGRVTLRGIHSVEEGALFVPSDQIKDYSGPPIEVQTRYGMRLSHRALDLGLRYEVLLRHKRQNNSKSIGIEVSTPLLEWADMKYMYTYDESEDYQDYVSGEELRDMPFDAGFHVAPLSEWAGTSIAARINLFSDNPRSLIAPVMTGFMGLEMRYTYNPVGLKSVKSLLLEDGSNVPFGPFGGYYFGLSFFLGYGIY